MKVTPFSFTNRSHQRSGATPVAILPDGRLIVKIGNDIFGKEDALAIEKLQTKLQGLTEKHPQLKESKAHGFLYETLGYKYLNRLLLLSPDRTKISGAMSFVTEKILFDTSDNSRKSYLEGLASVKIGGGKGLIAYLLDTCFKQPEHKEIDLYIMSDYNYSSFLNGQKKPNKPATFYSKFGFHPLNSDTPPGVGGGYIIIRKDLTPYAHETIKEALNTKNLPDPFALSHDLSIDDGNDYSKLESV